MKTKNPLYVVKGKDVLTADSLLDLVIKKLDLMPAINIIKNIFYLLLEQVQNFAMYQAVMKFMNEMIEKFKAVGARFGLVEN